MITLLPNFGAEEGDEGAIRHKPELRTAARLWRELFGPDVRVLDVEPQPPRFATGAAFDWIPAEGGVPWLSTPRASRRLEKLGLRLAAPDPEVVRRVHDKAFALRTARKLGLCPLGDRIRIFEPDELGGLEAALAALEPGTGWAVKPRFGSSGRGRIPVRGGVLPPLGGAIDRLARLGGAVLEPWLDRTADLSVQLHVDRDGAVRLLGSTRQILSSSGIYLGNRCLLGERPRAGTDRDDALEAAALQIGAAAAAQGFFGPCGIDAFLYRTADCSEVLRPVVELNARYTMGTVALGILERLRQQGWLGDARAYLFALRPPAQVPAGVRVVPLLDGAAAWLADDPDAF
ncbi:hypothetical protein [Vulgatibacter sp.]|uniref:hypothetical protein n=1 Tax=Vulgatibacter sp. TaxID=1971226 RepID=UPI003567F5EE